METSEGLHTFSRSDNPNIMVSFAEEPLFKKKKENIANWATRDIFVLHFAHYRQH